MLSTPCLSFPSCIREMPSLWLSLVTRLQKSLGEGTMSFIPAHGEHQAPHDAQSACGLIPQQHRGQGCHTTSETRAQDDTRASFVLEPVQGHKLFVELDISHTITYETGVRPSAYPAMSPQGQSRVGTHSGGTHPPWEPTAVPQHSKALFWADQHWDLEEAAVTWRKPLSPGGARVALLGQGCRHEHPVPLSPRAWGHPLAWSTTANKAQTQSERFSGPLQSSYQLCPLLAKPRFNP